MTDINNSSYMFIKDFILKNGYTWRVEYALEDYQKYNNGYYVSYTMEHIIKNCESHIKALLDMGGN